VRRRFTPGPACERRNGGWRGAGRPSRSGTESKLLGSTPFRAVFFRMPRQKHSARARTTAATQGAFYLNLQSTARASQTHRSLLSLGYELVVDAFRLFQKGAQDVSARHAPGARQRVGGAAARSGIARTHETGQPTRAFRWPTRCPQGVIVGSSNIGETKRAHRKVWHLLRLPGVPSSFHDVLRQRRLVDTCRDEPGLDTPMHAPVLRLQHKRGTVVLNGIHPRWHPSGLRQQHRRDAKLF
jgi:hypothetical protein